MFSTSSYRQTYRQAILFSNDLRNTRENINYLYCQVYSKITKHFIGLIKIITLCSQIDRKKYVLVENKFCVVVLKWNNTRRTPTTISNVIGSKSSYLISPDQTSWKSVVFRKYGFSNKKIHSSKFGVFDSRLRFSILGFLWSSFVRNRLFSKIPFFLVKNTHFKIWNI